MAAQEAKKATLHLYRHLLRAASYLPDEFAEVYMRNYIKQQFKRAKQTSEHTPRRLTTARSGLRTLQQAAVGDIQSLTGVLQRAYGRAGRRRRELVNDLLRIDGKHTAEGDAIAEGIIAESLNEHSKRAPTRPVLTMFLRNQAANNPPGTDRPAIRQFVPRMPESIWKRPLPQKRQRNVVKRFWASALDKILPPLPELEWNRLRDLATGVIPFQKRPRRCVAANAIRDQDEAMLNAATFLKSSVRHTARSQKDALVRQRELHKLSGRFMRRMWANVWNQCPLMTYDGTSMKWTIVWGGSRSAASQGLAGSAGRRDLELFEGVEDFQEESHNIRGKRRRISRPTEKS